MEPVVRPREEVLRPTAPTPFTAPRTPSPAIDSFLHNWIVQARKGLLELSALTALEDGERYGYEIVRDMAARPALGGAEGTVYPMLARLEDRGLLRTTLRDSGHGPTRKYYALTGDGLVALEDMRARFRELISGVLREDDSASPPQGADLGLRRIAR